MKESKKIIMEIIEKHVPLCKIILFGSRARKTNRPGSDIDLALDAGKEIGFDKILEIKGDLEESTIPYKVDIVDLHEIDDDLKEEITKEGISWK